jgi:hypothetical protein
MIFSSVVSLRILSRRMTLFLSSGDAKGMIQIAKMPVRITTRRGVVILVI